MWNIIHKFPQERFQSIVLVAYPFWAMCDVNIYKSVDQLEHLNAAQKSSVIASVYSRLNNWGFAQIMKVF